ncbi:MAG: putative TonB-dependent receptor [Verrucomicrobia bacterium]|nr:putative TonB-dependent receptor [Verrucomicrobiota bacterium]
MHKFARSFLIFTAAVACRLAAETAPGTETKPPASPATEPIVTLEKFVTNEKNEDPGGVMPAKPVSSIFGIALTAAETPRSVSVVSTEMLNQYGITNVEGLAAVVPNSYTSSAFGIAGSLDLRGTNAANFFRGMQRIENGGIFPTPIGATDSIDVVRGPPSPIYGPGKIGGYLNFVPKAARASTGKYLDRATSRVNMTYGTYDQRQVTAEQGGPLPFANRTGGYYVYALMENSGSYYDNTDNDQTILQTSFDVELTHAWRVEFGQQYQNWASTELSGTNRITQETVDHGTYLSGQPLVNLDTNGNGVISVPELGVYSFAVRYGTNPASIVLPASFALNPATIKLTTVDGNAIFTEPGDYAKATSACYFIDLINDLNADLIFKNQLFLDTTRRAKETTQGFATQASGLQFEEKISVEQRMEPFKWLKMANSAALSFRYLDAENAAYNAMEIYSRRDLAVGARPNDRVSSPLDDPGVTKWGTDRFSTQYAYGLGVITTATFYDKLIVVLGGRVDQLSLYSYGSSLATGDAAFRAGVRNHPFAKSYTESFSYKLTPGIIPYFTQAHQQALQIGNIGEVAPANVAAPLTDSILQEAGVKFSLYHDTLFIATDVYKQVRSQIDATSFETFSTEAKGLEIELRYVPTKHLSISGAMSWQQTVYLVPPTSFLVSPEFLGLTSQQALGGLLSVTGLPRTDQFIRRGGFPDKLFSLYGTYTLPSGWGATLGAVMNDRFASGSGRLVYLPAATNLSGAVFYARKKWEVRLRVNNITNANIWQSLAPDSTGNIVALKKPPRTYVATYGYSF